MSSLSSTSSSGSGAGAAGVITTTGKAVASPTSCSWQQVTENGKCYVEPRTCYDCLNKPLASGEECTLTPIGLCDSISQYDPTQDYQRPGAAGGFPIHYNYFRESNATYCEPNDAKCNLCDETTFTLNDNNPSTFCTGANDCVCVKVCESTAWRNETLERLKNTLAARNETANATCPIAANTSLIYGGSGSSSGSDNEVSPSIVNTQVVKNAYAREDACRWYQNQTFCDQPRTCYDCLNVPIYSGARCTINPLGFCASISEYDYTHDYRVRPSPSAGHYFPSNNATYCEADDAVCAKCRETTFKQSASGAVNPTQFCVGTNDCVCVAFCESPYWKSLVKDATCSTTVVMVSSERLSIATVALMMVGFTLLFTVTVQLLTIIRNRRHARREQERRERRQARSAFGNLQLQLDGWKSMCQELISKEQQFAGERQGSAILTHGDGPTVEIEEGDGYRPMSPSHPGAHPVSTTASASATAETRPAALQSVSWWRSNVDDDLSALPSSVGAAQGAVPGPAWRSFTGACVDLDAAHSRFAPQPETNKQPQHQNSQKSSATTIDMSSSDSSRSASTDDTITTIEQEPAVSLKSSCAWKEVATGSTCALKPRTCRECLNAAPSNGNECTLSPTGLCKNMDAYIATQDYRRTTSTGTEANYFPSSSASYCGASDSACTSCMHNATQVTHLSDFCTGKDGCVCVAICETAQWETLAEVQLPYAMNSEKETSTCESSVSTTADASAASRTSASSSTPAPTVKKSVFANEDRCTWYTNQTRCGLPRTCYDCLNVPLDNGEKCTITPSGYCASIHKYDPSLDFRLNASAGAQHYFPSTNTSYCDANDAVCAQCRATTFKASSDGTVNPSQYCVGENGCVCVAFCESSVWKPIVVDALCDTDGSSSSTSTNSLSMAVPIRAIALIIVVAIAVPSLIIVLLSCRARSQRQQNQARAEQRRCEGRGPSLELQAWKAMREELIENEHHMTPEEQRRRERRMSLPMSLRNSEALSSVARSSMDADRGDVEEQV